MNWVIRLTAPSATPAPLPQLRPTSTPRPAATSPMPMTMWIQPHAVRLNS